MPDVSLIVVSYNIEKYIGECLDSLLAQTLRPREIIVCDDCSTDSSRAIIDGYAARYPDLVKPIHQERNVGQTVNCAAGRDASTGELVSIMDGDDRWLPRKLELEWRALQMYPAAQVAYSNVYTIDEEGERTEVWYDGRGFTPPSGDVLVSTLMRRFFPNSSSVFRNQLLSRYAMDEIGPTDERLESYWDWDEKIRMAAKFPIVYSGEALVEYRIHDAGFSRSNPGKHARAFRQVYEKHLPLLEERSPEEVLLVRLNLETTIARQQERGLPPAERLLRYNAANVYDRNLRRYRVLAQHNRRALEAKVRPVLAGLALMALKQEKRAGHRGRAFRYWTELLRHGRLRPNLKLAARELLPGSLTNTSGFRQAEP